MFFLGHHLKLHNLSLETELIQIFLSTNHPPPHLIHSSFIPCQYKVTHLIFPSSFYLQKPEKIQAPPQKRKKEVFHNGNSLSYCVSSNVHHNHSGQAKEGSKQCELHNRAQFIFWAESSQQCGLSWPSTGH